MTIHDLLPGDVIEYYITDHSAGNSWITKLIFAGPVVPRGMTKIEELQGHVRVRTVDQFSQPGGGFDIPLVSLKERFLGKVDYVPLARELIKMRM